MRNIVGILAALAFFAAAPGHAADVRELWMAKCKSCHGSDGRADTKDGRKHKVADVTTADWQAKHTDDQIRKVIEDGSPDNEKMKPYKDKLSAEEIAGLVQYVRSLKAR